MITLKRAGKVRLQKWKEYYFVLVFGRNVFESVDKDDAYAAFDREVKKAEAKEQKAE